MAKKFFQDSDIPWASFHTFRREAGTVNLKTPPEEEPNDEDAPAVIQECQKEIAKRAEAEDGGVMEMDDADWHLETIKEKNLPVDEINAYNHMVIFLRWCMEHDLMGEEFLAKYGEVAEKVKADPAGVDLREFIRDELDGQLVGPMFNKIGRAFASYYYGEPDSPYFPNDIDDYAIGVIGQKRNYSDEIQDETYLFIPFDEDTLEPSQLAKAFTTNAGLRSLIA